MGLQEDLERAMRVFNEEQVRRSDAEFAEKYVADSLEKDRQEELLRVFRDLNNPKLNSFLQQPAVQPHLDPFGIHRATKQVIRGLAIRKFETPRSERRMAQSLTLVYMAFPREEGGDLFAQAPKDFKIDKSEVVVPERSTSLVFIKDVGIAGMKDGNGSIVKERKVEILSPERFLGAGIFETALTPDITPSDIKTWVEERLLNFIHTLNNLNK